MHTTLITDVKGNIDYYDIKDEQIFLKGWAFHVIYGICNIRLRYLINQNNNNNDEFKEIIKTPNYNNIIVRSDIIDFYKFDTNKNLCCGWDFTLLEKNIQNIKLEMLIENKWQIIFELDNSILKKKIFLKNYSCKKEKKYIPSFVVVDNFYEDVDSVRNFALSLDFQYNKKYHKGKRTNEVYKFDGLKERFESILNCEIRNWWNHDVNGCFQSCIGGEQLVYHCDSQEYAGIIFLTPDAPPQSGTSFYRSRHTKKMKFNLYDENEFNIVFKNGFLDSTEFELVDVVGNVYNRLVLFDAKMIHAASNYFGNNLNNGRLFQIFFFDLDM